MHGQPPFIPWWPHLGRNCVPLAPEGNMEMREAAVGCPSESGCQLCVQRPTSSRVHTPSYPGDRMRAPQRWLF